MMMITNKLKWIGQRNEVPKTLHHKQADVPLLTLIALMVVCLLYIGIV